MKFRITLTMDNDPGTYTVTGWDELRKEIERLEGLRKKWVVVRG
jgi:hypothetical protein